MDNQQILTEDSEITKSFKKHFYGVIADFDRESKRVLLFYEKYLELHPELKPLFKRVKRSLDNLENTFQSTENYIKGGKAEELTVKQPEIPFEVIENTKVDSRFSKDQIEMYDILELKDNTRLQVLNDDYHGSMYVKDLKGGEGSKFFIKFDEIQSDIKNITKSKGKV